MLPSTIGTASATQMISISMLNSSGHTHRYRRFAVEILADHYARLAEICVSVKLHITGLAPATLCQFAWRTPIRYRGKKVELGVPVSIIENDHRFILMWQIMWTECDVDLTVDLVDQCKKTYPNVHAMSFDRGYSSKPNMKALTSRLKHVILPKKGKLSKEDRARESAPEFKKRRRKHAQVESRINCLEQHGGDRIRTKAGKAGFARTVGASVVATNLCRMGAMLQERQYLEWRQAA